MPLNENFHFHSDIPKWICMRLLLPEVPSAHITAL